MTRTWPQAYVTGGNVSLHGCAHRPGIDRRRRAAGLLHRRQPCRTQRERGHPAAERHPPAVSRGRVSGLRVSRLAPGGHASLQRPRRTLATSLRCRHRRCGVSSRSAACRRYDHREQGADIDGARVLGFRGDDTVGSLAVPNGNGTRRSRVTSKTTADPGHLTALPAPSVRSFIQICSLPPVRSS